MSAASSREPDATPQFGLRHLLYAVALVAAALAAMGPWGLLLAALALLYWASESTQSPSHLSPWLRIVIVMEAGALAAVVNLPPPQISMSPSHIERCHNSLEDIAAAWEAYRADHGRSPPAVVFDDRGRPQHSWRALLLPYLREPDLHADYRFDESWDSPHNLQVARASPWLYRCPLATAYSESQPRLYVAVVGDGTLWEEDSPDWVTDPADGPGQTIVIVEAHRPAALWSEPRDLSVEEATSLLDGNTGPHLYLYGDPDEEPPHICRVHNAATDGGEVVRLVPRTDPEAARSLFLAADGKGLAEFDALPPAPPITPAPDPGWRGRFSVDNLFFAAKIALFVVLLAAPAVWPRRREPPVSMPGQATDTMAEPEPSRKSKAEAS